MAPAAKPPRIEIVDALRGFALFGILLVHASEWFAAAALPESVYRLHGQGPANGLAQGIVGVLFFGKFYTFFSFLFGLSFALMLLRTTEPLGRVRLRFAWRLVILGAIGLVHHLHWRGDILSIYALLGFALLPLARVPVKGILMLGLLLTLNVPGMVTQLYTGLTEPPSAADRQTERQAFEKKTDRFYKLMKHGAYPDLVRHNWEGFGDKMAFQLESGRLSITLGFFLLGLYAGRRQLFQQLDRKKQFFRRLARYAGFGTLGLTGAAVILFFLAGSEPSPPTEGVFMMLYNAQSALLTVFYIAGLTLLFQVRAWQWAVPPLAAIGKMALTNYLFQTLMGTLLFMGYGMNFLGEIEIWQAVLLTIPIFFLQVVLSQLWLSQFRYGPLEWIWRLLTYGKVPPLQIAGNRR